MNHELTFTPTQIQKFSKAFATTRNTDWKLQTNSVTTVQAFRTLLSAFPGLLRDWKGFYTTAKRANGRPGASNTRRAKTNARKTTSGRKSTRSNGTKRSSTTHKRSTTRTGAGTKRWNGKKSTTTRSATWNKRSTSWSKSRRAA